MRQKKGTGIYRSYAGKDKKNQKFSFAFTLSNFVHFMVKPS